MKENVTIQKNIEWDNIDYIVCCDVSYFDDNKRGSCTYCNCNIFYRPHMPVDVKKICGKCFLKEVNIMPKGADKPKKEVKKKAKKK